MGSKPKNTADSIKSLGLVALSPIMTLPETAEYLRISQATLGRLIRRGEIPHFRVGSDYRFRLDQIDKWIDGQKSGSR
jgi:excisionase family DNA binding protein